MSREVQDILGDSEEQGGLGAEIVITEEDEEDEDEDIDESDEDSDELSKMLDKANAKIKQEQQQMKQDPLAIKLKEELNIKPEPAWPGVKEEIGK